MRKFLIAVAAFTVAIPASAQPSDSWDYESVGESVDFDRAAGALEQLVDVMMAIPVGGIAAAIDPLGRGGVYPHDTLGSLSRRNDPGAADRIRADIRGAARTARTTSRAIARMMPVLERSYDQLRAGLAEAIDAAQSE